MMDWLVSVLYLHFWSHKITFHLTLLIPTESILLNLFIISLGLVRSFFWSLKCFHRYSKLMLRGVLISVWVVFNVIFIFHVASLTILCNKIKMKLTICKFLICNNLVDPFISPWFSISNHLISAHLFPVSDFTSDLLKSLIIFRLINSRFHFNNFLFGHKPLLNCFCIHFITKIK